MNRPRIHDKHLPRNVYLRHGAYYFVKGGKWTRIGKTLKEALNRYAGLYETKTGSMPALISRALPYIKNGVKPNTTAQYEIAARKLVKVLAEFDVEEVTQATVTGIKRQMVGTPNMANRCLSVLRMVFHFALEEGSVTSNPVIGIVRLEEKTRDRLPSLDELGAVYSKCGPRTQVIVDLLVRTGQRITDILHLRRSDISDEGLFFTQQKTGAKVLVPWTAELREVVDRARSLSPNVVAFTLLHNRRGKAPDYRTVKDQWDKACKAANVTDFHLHDLRAVAATWAKRQGKNATTLLGHKSESQTTRYLRGKEAKIADAPSFGRLLDGSSKKA